MSPPLVLALALLTLPNATKGQPSPVNVALHRPYALTPQPNYKLTTDAGDSSQLTDGRLAGGGFWTEKGCVGWTGVRVVSITIDLGSEFEISGASFSTAAGRADVEWPSDLLVLGSVDGRRYSLLGDLASHQATTGERASDRSFERRVIASHELTGQARFVRFMVGASGPYVFVDEIEVFGQPAVASSEPRSATADTDALFWRTRAASRLRSEVERRVVEARTRVSAARIATNDRTALLAALSDVGDATSRLTVDDWNAVSTKYPMNDVHSAALRIIGAIEHLEGAPSLSVWPANPWDPLDMTTPPPPAGSPAISVALMNGEVRSAALNLRNSTAEPIAVAITLADSDALEPVWIEARAVAWSGDSEARPVALAVPEPTRSSAVTVVDIPAGVTSQVWLTFAPTRLPQGQHERTLRVGSPRRPDASVPVNVTVLPGRFPVTPRLHLGGWDYLDARRDAGSADTLAGTASLLREFGVDLPWATPAAMPFGDYRADGTMAAAPDTSVFDSWVLRWPHAARYRVFVSAGDNIAGLQRGTQAFASAIQAWTTFWAEHIAARGIRPSNIELLFVDEPRGNEGDAERQIDWARALSASRSAFRVWLDPVYVSPDKTPAELVSTSHTLCLNRRLLEHSGQPYEAFARALVTAGKTVELYGTDGPATRLDPYTYYRLMAWRAFDVSASGVNFWSFSDTGGGSSWREYLAPRTAYSPLFLDGRSAEGGKHMYAIQEGVEDYEYLALLRDAIAREAMNRALEDAVLAHARSVLSSALSRVLRTSRVEAYPWIVSKDRTVADATRLEIANELQRLASGAPSAP